MEKRRILGISVIVIAALLLSTVRCDAIDLWRDDFDEGNHDGWTPHQAYGTNSWTSSDCCLRINQEYPGVIYHSSVQSVGTWEFDVRAGRAQFGVYFMSTHYEGQNWTGYGVHLVGIVQADGDILRLSLKKKGYSTLSDEGADYLEPFSGEVLATTDIAFDHLDNAWQHIKVDRTSAGLFSVYVNGNLALEVTDTEFDSSEYFTVSAEEYRSIDNVVVSEGEVEDGIQDADMNPLGMAGLGSAIFVCCVVLIHFTRPRTLK
ncbi:MAG: hypothetical protein ACW98Y_09985 [Candidatus Thorarchaeota archaeon]|jgi:hypothetical protein